MAFRTWIKLLGATLGVAALAGASQLGVAYGLGILQLTRFLDVTTRDQWTAQLAWVAWFAMMAAVLGGLAGSRLRDRWRAAAGPGTSLSLALSAGVGAAVVVPLTMQPARTAQSVGVHPVFVIGLCAGLGALAGTFAAYAALTQVVARWNLRLFGLIVWTVALISVGPSLAPGNLLPAVRLGVFDADFLPPSVSQRTALFTMPAVALVVGAALGWAARRRAMPTLTIALAGLPGPALLTLSYLIAGPGSDSDRYQVVPYWAAMTATGAGVLGSVLAAVIRRADEESGGEGGEGGEVHQNTTELATPPIPGQRSASDEPASVPDRSAAGSAAAAGRRSSAAETFTGRSAEWPTRGTDQPGSAGRGSAFPGTTDSGDTGGPDTTGLSRSGLGNAGWDSAGWDSPGWVGAGRDNAGRTSSGWDDVGPAGRSGRDRGDVGPGRTDVGPAVRSGGGWSGGGWSGGGPDRAEVRGPRHTGIALGEYAEGQPERFGAVTLPQSDVPAPRPPGDIEEPPARGGGFFAWAHLPFGRDRGREAKATPDVPQSSRQPQSGPLPHVGRPDFVTPANEPTWPGRNPLPDTRIAPPGRGPLVPEPRAASAPLPHPNPITPPLPVTPAPDSIDNRRGRKRRNDAEFVDWVNGLGGRRRKSQ